MTKRRGRPGRTEPGRVESWWERGRGPANRRRIDGRVAFRRAMGKARARHERLGRAASALTLGKPGVVSTGDSEKRPAASTVFRYSLGSGDHQCKRCCELPG